MTTADTKPDLLSLVAAAGIPVSVDTAAIALNVSPEQIMSIGTELVAAGRLSESSAGYRLAVDHGVDLSPAVAAFMAGHLADALTVNGGNKADIGRLLNTAGRFAAAWRTLAEAALDSGAKHTDHEKVELLELALTSLAEAKLDGGELEGRVHLNLARIYRSRGDSQNAKSSVEAALHKLRGEDLVDALGFGASVADDLQHPQEAERWVALAELAAAQEGSMAKLGSLLTFHGRELSRLGFAAEAEASLAKGNTILLNHGSATQRFYGRLNQAWVDLDQGQMRSAEAGFALLRDEAYTQEGEASQADKEAYWARALFGIGRADLALEAIERAHTMSDRSEAIAPRFIADLAQAEGGVLFENWEQALDGANNALEVSLAHLPAHENVCRFLRARALRGTGQLDEARSELELARAATPVGANGTRWRLRIEELSLELSDAWDQRKAEDLTDQLLQSRWLGAAVDLMTARAVREKDRELAAEAAALAVQVGNPIQAIKAVNAGNLWQEPLSRPVIAAIHPIVDHLPPDWMPRVLSQPAGAAALAEVTEVGEEEVGLLRDKISDALASAGLAGDMVLSPAQRRTAGLVRRRRPQPRPLRWLAAAAAVLVIAVGASLAVVNLTREDLIAAPTTTAPATTTTAPALEDTIVAAPETGLGGTALFRSDPGRSGVIASGGVREVGGTYWRDRPGGSLVTGSSAVGYGRYLFVATDENRLYGLEQTGGRLNLSIQTDAAITATPVIGQPGGGEADPILVFPTSDGEVHAYSALRSGTSLWDYSTGAPVRAPALIVGESVFVTASDGYLHAIDLLSGQALWRYPAEESAGTFQTAPAFDNGVVYINSREGFLHVVDATTGESICPTPVELIGAVVTHPVISGGVVFVGVEQGGIHAYAAGSCGTPADGYSAFYPSSRAVREGLTVVPDTLYLLEDRLVIAMSLDGALWVDAAGTTPSPWNAPFAAESLITTAPVLAEDVLYLGTQDGIVHAIDAVDGAPLWQFNAGAAVRGETIVAPGAVFVTTADGEIIAIAQEQAQ